MTPLIVLGFPLVFRNHLSCTFLAVQMLKQPASGLEGKELGRGKVHEVFFVHSSNCIGERPEL